MMLVIKDQLKVVIYRNIINILESKFHKITEFKFQSYLVHIKLRLISFCSIRKWRIMDILQDNGGLYEMED